MVHSITPDDDSKILESHQKAKRFAYSKAAGNDPWSKFNADKNENNSLDVSFHSNHNYPKPSQFKGKSLHNYLESTKSFNKSNGYSKNKQSKGLNLDNVWSIRNNVPFSSQTRLSPSSVTVKPSYYSRYKLSNAGGGKTITEPVASSGHHFNQDTPWNTKQSQFSYSESNNKFKSSEDDDEFEHDLPLANALTNNLHRDAGGGRPMTARTEKARKMHEAYLKSTGLGKYAAPANTMSRHEGKGIKRKPTLGDETQR